MLDFVPPPHPDPTPDDTTIWRYMDLPRFISLLATKELWFAKAASFRDDPFEGFCVAAHQPIRPDLDKNNGPITISVDEMLGLVSRDSALVCENAGGHLYVNSWCLGPTESMAMWQIYGSAGHGVAIRSTVGRYKRAARFGVPPRQYAFGAVTYHDDLTASPEVRRDFSRGTIPVGIGLLPLVLQLAFHKRSCFEFEKEWRAALYQDPQPEDGGTVEFDLNVLIAGVHVGPRAPDFLYDAVSSVMGKYDLRKPLERSNLMRSPLYATATPSAG